MLLDCHIVVAQLCDFLIQLQHVFLWSATPERAHFNLSLLILRLNNSRCLDSLTPEEIKAFTAL